MEDRLETLLLATASSQGHATEDLIDRLSDLPDKVVHRILSLLEFTDLTCFGCVSKRFQQLYLSTPSLNFDGFSSRLLRSYDQRLRLWSRLDRYLFNRGVRKIERFRFHWELHYDGQHKGFRDNEKFRLENWIRYAVRCDVEVLDIHISHCEEEKLPLPHWVLLAGSLKSLAVDMLYGKISKTPSLASFSNMERLKLQRVNLPDEGIFKWISCSCKCLKELSLTDVIWWNLGLNVTIESSCLESLCIEDTHFINHLFITGEKLKKVIINWTFGFWTDNPHTDKSLYICAPNLNSLNWTGSLMNQRNLGRLECLEEATIGLLPSVDDFVYVSEVLSCLSSAKVLTLNKETTMALFKGGSKPLLENVCYLCIHIEGFLDIIVPAMTSILGGMCKLNTLVIKSDSFFRGLKADSHGFKMGYWEQQNSTFISQLEEVTIELCHGSNGIEFAKYILEYTQNLNKMTLVHSPQQCNAISKLKEIKMASNVTLDFQEDQGRGPQKRRGRKVP